MEGQIFINTKFHLASKNENIGDILEMDILEIFLEMKIILDFFSNIKIVLKIYYDLL